jgi:hypothetical protein
MRSNRKETKQRKRTIRVWTLEEATAAVPYIAAVVRSLRDHWLEAAAHYKRVEGMDKRPGRPNRTLLIAKEEALKDARDAESRFGDAQAELAALDIYSLEPGRGQALVPFVYENELAWFLFDLYDPESFRYWRFHTDPLDARRAISQVLSPPAETKRSA